MCGILACVHCGPCKLEVPLLDRLKRRGPDQTSVCTVSLPPPSVPSSSSASSGSTLPHCQTDSQRLSIDLVGTLLCMRGEETPQPLGNEKGDYLLWNGNVFGGEIEIPPEKNDTVRLLEELGKQSIVPGILSTLSGVHGPWAFIFWQKSTRSLWFGRDVFGRRSLLWHFPLAAELDSRGGCFCLSSVGHYEPEDMPLGYWLEVPASGIFQLKLTAGSLLSAELICYPWMEEGIPFQNEADIIKEISVLSIPTILVKSDTLRVPFLPFNKLLPDSRYAQREPPSYLGPTNEASKCGDGIRGQAIGAPLFIGTNAKLELEVQEDPKIEEAGVVSLPPQVKERLDSTTPPAEANWPELAQQLIVALQGAIEARVSRAPRSRPLAPLEKPVESGICTFPSFDREGGPECPATSAGVREEEKRKEKDEIGTCSSLPRPPLSSPAVVVVDESPEVVHQGKARIGILYSGGVDSVVLAALTDRCIEASEEVDLINVAFEQKSSQPSAMSSEPANFDVPDRISAIRTFQQFQHLNPDRKFNLLLVNVTLDEVNTMRRERISQLIYPLSTVLDDSIGCAIWFAARGEGLLYGSSKPDCGPEVQYRSSARTLFVGMGADEQLAGYSRHRTKFNVTGWSGLVTEVEMDIKRLARRNLGRDDRCIADHQREGQFPFLDEAVVAFLQQLPMWYKVDLSLPRGVGEKRLLREVAYILGCSTAASLPKRAIQFGSRMAKLTGSQNRRTRQHGSDVSNSLFPAM